MTVEYREIAGYPGYRVGDDGSVWFAWVNTRWGRRLRDTWKRMKPGTHHKGYLYVNLTPAEGGSYKTFRVHRLILGAFVGPCPEGMQCRHLNGIKKDCSLGNLKWGTHEENCEDNRRLGSYTKASRTRWYTHDGKTMCLKDWARHLNVPYTTLYLRIRRLVMSFVDAISAPFEGLSANGGRAKRLTRSTKRSPTAGPGSPHVASTQ